MYGLLRYLEACCDAGRVGTVEVRPDTTSGFDASHPSFSLPSISSNRLKGLLIQQQQQRAIIIELPVNMLIKGKFPLSTPAVTEICHTRSSCNIQFVIHHHYADYPSNKLPGLVQSGNLRCCIETGVDVIKIEIKTSKGT